MRVSVAEIEHGQLGVYLKPKDDWALDRYMDTLGATATLALRLAREHPAWGDVEVCEDALYLGHGAAHFVPATRVVIHQRGLSQLPEQFASASAVLKALQSSGIELFVEPQLVPTAAYRDAVAHTAD